MILAAACSQINPTIVVPTPTPEATPEPSTTPVAEAASPSATATPPAMVQLPPQRPVESATPVPSGGRPAHATASSVSEPPERDLFALAHRLGKVSPSDMPVARTVNPQPVSYQEGHEDSFFVTDLLENRTYTVQATLKVVSENAYWYVDDSIELSEDGLRDAARTFEEDIRPAIVDSFGDIWTPGVDNDPRLVVLHTPLRAADGYFGSSDEYPRATHPRSNQREIIYMDGGRLEPGTTHYLSVLAHEFQHAVHWNQDAGEDAWINEGMSEVAKELAGYPSFFVNAFLRRPTIQLNFWPDALGTSAPHYGGATLFLSYLAQHYGGYDNLKHLVQEPLDGINGVEAYLSSFDKSFVDVFKDWIVANYLDAPDGPYGYPDRDVRLQDIRPISDYGDDGGTLPQFAARYIDLRLPEGDALLGFEGAAEVAQVGTHCYSGGFCWWSNTGDAIDSTLTRDFDLSGLEEATLEFRAWYSIEEDWDYAYVVVSTDGGDTWTVLEGQHTTDEDPVGNSYGHGFTGRSGEWVQERIDLSDYAGGEILVRFEYITDDAVNLDGLVIDDIAIPELGFFDDAEQNGGWRAAGFLRIDNALPQDYAVQVVEIGTDGLAAVREMPLDEGRKGQLLLEGFGSRLEHAVVIIAPVTRDTYQPAPYRLMVQPASP